MIDPLSANIQVEDLSSPRPVASECPVVEGDDATGETSLPSKVLEHLPLPVIAVDARGRVTLANRRARTLTGGISRGRMLFEFFPDSVTGRVTVVLATGTARTIRDCAIGDRRFVVDCAPVPEGADSTAGVLVLIPA
jgi:transcriptional regulator of aromatic amino acid metabolism